MELKRKPTQCGGIYRCNFSIMRPGMLGLQRLICLLILMVLVSPVWSIEVSKVLKHNTSLYLAMGNSDSDHQNYDSDRGSQLMIRYLLTDKQTSIEGGVVDLGKFTRNNGVAASVEVEGAQIAYSRKIYSGKKISINTGIHALSYESTAFILGADRGTNSDVSLGLGLRSAYQAKQLVINAQYQWYHDVSGTDISVVSLGIQMDIPDLF